MSPRNVITALTLLLCLGTVSAVVLQRQQLNALRAQEDAQPAQPEAGVAPQIMESKPGSSPDELSTEILRLRSEVTRLTARKRELAGVIEEGERLRAQLAGQTNVPAEKRLPEGFMRKSEAQMMGYSTPENTLQTFLWALQHKDIEAFFRCLTPVQAEQFRTRLQSSPDSANSFFKGSEPIPGLGIVERQVQPDGSVQLQVTFGPGLPMESFRARAINGEWKLEGLEL